MLAQNLDEIQQQSGFKVPNTLGDIIYNALPYVYGLAGILLLIYLVFGGLQLMLAKGDPKAIQAAQSKITSALIGFILVIIAYFLTRLLGQLFGIGAFNPIFGGGPAGVIKSQ